MDEVQLPRSTQRKDGVIGFDLPHPYSEQRLSVVDRYNHLGSFVSTNECLTYDAQHRCSSAVSAYVPIAMRIFGSSHIHKGLKIHFMSSLILSRLLHNTQTWVPQAASMQRLNCVYMRVLRRIADDRKFQKCHLTVIEVRKLLLMPSIECLIMRRRLLYLARIVASGHKSLVASLALSYNGERLPSVVLICKGMSLMYERIPAVRGWLPAPYCDPFAWAGVLKEFPFKWHEFVQQVDFYESVNGAAPVACVSHPPVHSFT